MDDNERVLVGVGGAMGDVTTFDPVAWDRDFRINVTSMALMSRYAVPEMRKLGRGAIVNMSSVSGRMSPTLFLCLSGETVVIYGSIH